MEELEKMLELFPEKECPNINSAFRKLHANLMFRSARAAVSISGGSDSDVMLDMIQALNPAKNYPSAKIHYVWFNTGIEYTATKEHLGFLEEKYGVTIEQRKAKTPVPLGCKTWGQPFMSKQISQYISRLQAHGFQWEDEPFEILYARYPNCKAALRWWCNAFGPGSRMNIEKCRLLKEFMIANPPKIGFSDGCCKGAKKDVAHDYIKEIKATINIVGIRKAEGGARATAYNSCFSEPSSKSEAAQFRPLFYFTDTDKELYCQRRGVVHSDLYEKYGFKRTGCACCPFGSRFEMELQAAEQLDPGLAMAAKKFSAGRMSIRGPIGTSRQSMTRNAKQSAIKSGKKRRRRSGKKKDKQACFRKGWGHEDRPCGRGRPQLPEFTAYEVIRLAQAAGRSC